MKIDIISDVTCPYCLIGFLQLRRAIANTKTEAQITWHPYEINPHIGEGGLDVRQNLHQKYGRDFDQIETGLDNLIASAAALSFEFNYPEGKKAYNSIWAHVLIAWADEHDKATEMKMALFAAFFTHGLDYSDTDVLVKIASDLGLDGDVARLALGDVDRTNRVTEEIAHWQKMGISGVPSVIFNEKHLVNGAQGIEGFTRAIEQIREMG